MNLLIYNIPHYYTITTYIYNMNTSSIPVIIGSNIRIFRKIKNIKVQEIAQHLGISVQQMYKYESGQSVISSVDLIKVAALFNINPFVLINKLEIAM